MPYVYAYVSGSKPTMRSSRMNESILLWLYAMMRKDEKWL